MPDLWLPGAVRDPGLNAGYRKGKNSMRMPVWHWTVGTDSRALCRDQGLCNLLYPKVGAPFQFAEIDAFTFHAWSDAYGRYSGRGPGFEVERFPDEPLTDDQEHWIGQTIAWLHDEWDVPDVQYRGPRFPWHGADFHGHVNHRDLHPNPDGISEPEWDAVTVSPPAPVPVPSEGQKMELVVGPIQGQPVESALLLVGDRVVAFWPDARNAADWRANQSAGVDLVALTNDPFGVNAKIMGAIKDGTKGPGL